MQSQEARTALGTLARIGAGAILGACSGALAAAAIALLVIERVPALGVGGVMGAFVGNGVTFGAITGAVVAPIIISGPLAAIPVRRWAPAAVLVTALFADAGLLLGNFFVERAGGIYGGMVPGRPGLEQPGAPLVLVLPASPEIGLFFAMAFGIAGFVGVALTTGMRDDAARRRARARGTITRDGQAKR